MRDNVPHQNTATQSYNHSSGLSSLTIGLQVLATSVLSYNAIANSSPLFALAALFMGAAASLGVYKFLKEKKAARIDALKNTFS